MVKPDHATRFMIQSWTTDRNHLRRTDVASEHQRPPSAVAHRRLAGHRFLRTAPITLGTQHPVSDPHNRGVLR